MIYYETYGNKFNPMILFLHSAGYVHCFAKQYELQKNYYLVVPHLPGFGKATGDEFKVDKAVDQIVELAQFFDRPITLVGFSLGAQLCMPLMCKHGDLFNGCVFVSPWLLKTKEELEKAVNQVDDTAKVFYNSVVQNMNAISFGLNAERRKEHTEYCKNVKINNIVAAVDNGIEFSKYPEFTEIKKPMLAICGLKEMLDIRKTVREMAHVNANCTYDMWDGATHNIPYKYHNRLNKAIEELVDKANAKK